MVGYRRHVRIGILFHFLRSTLINLQSPSRAYIVGEQHYDIGNDLYAKMLDKRMVYSCGYWSAPLAPARNLDEAQEGKLDLICKKLGLKPGQKILDVGCGWGSFAKFAAEKYGVGVVGITISKEQAALARERCKGLPIEIRVEDYRSTAGTFDHIVSVGMFEHVGLKNYRTFFKKMKSLLKDDGLFLLHTIGSSVDLRASDPWIEKYIFPGGLLPSVGQIGKALDRQFVVEDWHNFGADYDTTLMAWYKNFERAWPTLQDKYDERFRRMWRYYLMSMAGMFRSRGTQLWQIVLSKRGVHGGNTSVR